MATFKFDRHFQTQILALMMQDLEFLIFGSENIDPDYFSDVILAWFYKQLRDHFLDYQILMQPLSLRNELLQAAGSNQLKQKDVARYQSIFATMLQPVMDTDYIKDQVVTFCRHQAIRKAALEMPKLLTANQFEEIEESMNTALQVGVNIGSVGVQFFQDYVGRIRDREGKRDLAVVPTGITELDMFMRGGLRAKQLGIWMAPTSRGKSLALVHCGKRAVIMGRSVLHYTFELSEDEVSDRYDSSFSRIPIDKLIDREVYLRGQMDKLGKRFGNRLIIKEYPSGSATVNTIRSHIRQCLHIGFVPDIILVDYLDLMRPIRARRERREELSDTTTELRGLAGELALPLWSATQSQRIAISMETHTEEQVGEDIGKVNIADVVITLNQTKEELHQEIMRLFLAKNRNGRRYVEVPIQTAFERMAFYEPLRA